MRLHIRFYRKRFLEIPTERKERTENRNCKNEENNKGRVLHRGGAVRTFQWNEKLRTYGE